MNDTEQVFPKGTAIKQEKLIMTSPITTYRQICE